MADGNYTPGGQQYTLRAAGPMPIYSGGNVPSAYVIHSFGADISDIDIYECTDTLLKSTEFKGQSISADLTSANFSSVGDRDGKIFQGRAVHYPVFSKEDQLSFNKVLDSCVGKTPSTT